MDLRYISLFLDAPLQSWGNSSRYKERTTRMFPTYSGIMGMICAALGIDRTDNESLKELNPVKISIYNLKSGEGILKDFHTVGGGWDKKVYPQNVVPKADGKSGQTVLTHREYLQDFKFGAILSAPVNLAEKVSRALKNPVWGLWLGRKACIPSSIIFQGIFENESSALDKLILISEADNNNIQILKDVEKFEEGSDSIMDIPLDFAKRKFMHRRIIIQKLE